MSDSLKSISKSARQYKYILLLARHAKAEPSADGSDIDRKLTDKGLKQAKRVGKGLAAMKLVPDSIVCSGAVRTRETLERMLKTFGDGPGVVYRRSLYDQTKNSVFDELKQAAESTHILMILGHEPTVSTVAGRLASEESDSGLLASLSVGVSNGTVCILGSDVPFSQWGEHSTHLVAVLSPKDFD